MPALDPAFLTTPIAHRALHDVAEGRPENSRAAIRAAIAHGYGIEIDLQLSHDGEAMVFHDATLSRLTHASGPVHERSAAELGRLPLRGGEEAGECVPTLGEVLELVAGRVPVLVEVKDQDGFMGSNVGPLERRAAELIAAYAGPIAVMSFNPYSIAEMAHFLPETPRGLTTDGYTAEDWPRLPPETRDRLRAIPDYERLGCSFISHNINHLDSPRVAELRATGATVLCWTVTNPAQEAHARPIAHNITFEKYLAAKP